MKEKIECVFGRQFSKERLKMFEEKNKVYVGNLEFSTTEDELGKFFKEKGIQPKRVTIIKDKFKGGSKGFGFVELDNPEDLDKAITQLNGQEFRGRTLRISKAREQQEKFER